jgi:hypothetical protein
MRSRGISCIYEHIRKCVFAFVKHRTTCNLEGRIVTPNSFAHRYPAFEYFEHSLRYPAHVFCYPSQQLPATCCNFQHLPATSSNSQQGNPTMTTSTVTARRKGDSQHYVEGKQRAYIEVWAKGVLNGKCSARGPRKMSESIAD